jgi:hypothetical protein
MAKWLSTFLRQYRMQRTKAHGAGHASIAQAALFAAMGAHLASRWGPNPTRLWWRLSRVR